MSAPFARPSRKTLAAALDALAIATPAEIRAAADLLDGEDGRDAALLGLLEAAVALGRYHADRADGDAADIEAGRVSHPTPHAEADALRAVARRASIAVARAEDALDEMRHGGA